MVKAQVQGPDTIFGCVSRGRMRGDPYIYPGLGCSLLVPGGAGASTGHGQRVADESLR